LHSKNGGAAFFLIMTKIGNEKIGNIGSDEVYGWLIG
jgi:hypothetical protein